MLAVRSIVCSVDFSDQSRHALRWAAAIAARQQAGLTVVTAVEPLLANAAQMRLGTDLVRTETEPALREFVDAVVRSGAAPAGPALVARAGEPDDVILETAARENADLIVMGTQGLGGLRKFLLGSTTERVLRRTDTAVLVVPPGAADPLPLDPGAGPGLRKILAATDFSATSLAALEWAASLAEAVRATLLIAHAVAPVAVAPRWRPYVAEADDARVDAARARLDGIAARLSSSLPRDRVVSLGRPADAIASIAEERGADLIVMGLTGGREAASTRPGSIAYQVLTLSRVPVLVVPAPQSTRT